MILTTSLGDSSIQIEIQTHLQYEYKCVVGNFLTSDIDNRSDSSIQNCNVSISNWQTVGSHPMKMSQFI